MPGTIICVRQPVLLSHAPATGFALFQHFCSLLLPLSKIASRSSGDAKPPALKQAVENSHRSCCLTTCVAQIFTAPHLMGSGRIPQIKVNKTAYGCTRSAVFGLLGGVGRCRRSMARSSPWGSPVVASSYKYLRVGPAFAEERAKRYIAANLRWDSKAVVHWLSCGGAHPYGDL